MGLGLVCAMLLSGCYANYPLGSVERAVFDERLLGRWTLNRASDKDSDDPQVMVVARFDEQSYVSSPADVFSPREATRFYIIEIDGQTFFNAQDLRADLDRRGWMFARYTMLDSDTVRIDVPGLDANPHTVASSAALRAVFAERGRDTSFYSDDPMIASRLPDGDP